MAAGDTATVFLETTLGTRLVVSFPARATTAADLKHQASAEHAACFPRTGPIAVTSLQIKLDGSWFQLTDSMVVRAAFEWVKGPWRLLAEAHELRSHPLARKDAKCGTGDAEPNAGHPVISENSSQYMLPPAASQVGGILASGDGVSDTPQMNKQDKPQEGVEHVSGQCRDGINMPQESSDFDLAAGHSDSPPMNLQDKSPEGVEHASGHSEDRTSMLQESSDLVVAADKGNRPVRIQQKDITAEPRGKKRFREEDKTNKSTTVNCGENLSSLASSTSNAELSEKQSCLTEQAKSNSVPLLYNLEGLPHGLGKKHSGGQEPWASGVRNGEISNNGSDIPPCVESMERYKSSEKEVRTRSGDKEEPFIAGCAGQSSGKRTDVPHCVESMKEDIKGPACNSHYLDKGKTEGATSTVSKEYEPCLRSHQRIVVRKVPMSRAMKMYSFRC